MNQPKESPDTLLARVLENMNSTWIATMALAAAAGPEDKKAVEHARGSLAKAWSELEALAGRK